MDARRPWDRRPDETATAFAAFSTYAGMGPARNLRAVQGGTGAAPGRRSAAGHIYRWAAEHEWTDRAAAFDRHQAEERARVMEDAARRAAEQEAEDWSKFRRDYALALRSSFLIAATAQNELAVAAKSPSPDGKPAGVDVEAAHRVQRLVDGAMRHAERAMGFAAPHLLPGHQTPETAEPVPGDIGDREAMIFNRAMAEARERGEID